jgi:uncharacterized membrane protein HdeD (DUF308 family)
MITALFVEFPTTGPSDAWKFAMTSAPVLLHMLLGILILLGSIMVLIRAITKKDHRWIIVGSIGLVATLVANLGGGDFIGSQNAASSLVMAIAFIVAVIVYGWGLLKKA